MLSYENDNLFACILHRYFHVFVISLFLQDKKERQLLLQIR
ncbi:MAG: hypothetical protein K0S23_645 [Fluviicola sp.]|jgi:hypothetical protein|nr:hypothetical protein [Fluviicola sp.]